MLTWEAFYTTGSLSQYNEDGTENKYTDINRNILTRFLLKDTKVRFVLNLDTDKKLIYRKRIAKSLMNNVKETVYIIGYQHGSNQSINFYFESTGHVETTDGFKEGHKWYYPVVFLEEEL